MSTTQQQTPPDVRQLAGNDLPESTFPGGRKQPFRIFFDPAVHEQIGKHATENAEVEICGVVVGKWARDADGPFVLISDAIRGDAASNKFAEVTFTHDTWAKINEQMDSRFAHLSIVGWYHSHPDFGVFLSDRDRFIQEHFFSGAGQIAYVVDPVRRTEGIFTWHEGKPTLVPHYWVGDRIQVTTAAGREKMELASAAPSQGSAVSPTIPGRSSPDIDWLTILTQAGLCVLLLLVGYMSGRMLADGVNERERERIRQEANQYALGRWAVLTVRPGLTQAVNQLDKTLEAAIKNTDALARQHIKLSEKPNAIENQWKEAVLLPLVLIHRGLDDIQMTYGLTPDEEKYIASRARGKSKAEKDAAQSKKKKADRNKKAKDSKKVPKGKKTKKDE